LWYHAMYKLNIIVHIEYYKYILFILDLFREVEQIDICRSNSQHILKLLLRVPGKEIGQ